jgi:hypothetical protein
MIIVNLKGGLGNQMFQYALGRHLAEKNKVELKLDTTSLSKAKELGNIYRPFDLDAFNIKNEQATPLEIQALRYPYGFISKFKSIFERKILRKTFVTFDEKVLELKDGVYLDGYWQSPKYFEAIRDTLLTEFTLKTHLSPSGQALQDKILSSTSVSLHVRRGDYVANKRVLKENGICSVEYYKQAIGVMATKVADPTFFVFSDDIQWVKTNLPLPTNAVFVSDETISAPEELFLMSACKHNIIANSSFSWWGAWLNQNEDKTVIAPTPWFDTITYDANLIPDTWIQLQK